MSAVISLGAGVQSTTMALMAAHGEITPMPSCAIFADTGWEPAAVYAHLDWLCSANVLPFPVHRVTRGNFRQEAIDFAHGRPIGHAAHPQPPFHLRLHNGEAAMSQRQCTRDYKLQPLSHEIARQLGVRPGKRVKQLAVVEVWVGISRDEAHRMKPAKQRWQSNRFPLIEAGMSRADCLGWLRRHDYPRPPKSACIGCPYHSDEQWQALTADEFADAVAFEAAMQAGTVGFTGGTPYLHRSLVPLDQVDFSRIDATRQADLFGEECEGMCGV